MLTERQKSVIASMPETEYGQALAAWLNEEIRILEEKEESGMKICDDPLIEDFRVQLGMKIAFRRTLKKPKQILEELNKEAKK